MAEGAPILPILTAAAVTYGWRALGVALSDRVDPQGRAVRWVGCVAYALLAGLIARMIVLPQGPLAETVLLDRLAAAAAALAIFLFARRNLFVGLLAGLTVLVLMSLARG